MIENSHHQQEGKKSAANAEAHRDSFEHTVPILKLVEASVLYSR